MGTLRRLVAPSAENLVFVLFLLFMLIYPQRVDDFGLLSISQFLAFALLAVSLALIWGYAGILSFGQTAFFGVGGYGFGIFALNYLWPGSTLVGIVVGMVAGAVVAAIIAYFMFYGGVNDVFVGMTTLALTLVLQTFMAQTAGPEWTVGAARLNGYNGMYAPQITIGETILYGKPLVYFYLAIVVVVYLVLRGVTGSRWGYGLLALRENRVRTETFGYNVKLMQVQVFALAGGVAGLSGVLYTSWGGYIDPSSMGLAAAVAPVIYVAIGGRTSLTAALIASMILLKLSQSLASQADNYALLIFGTVALVAVLFVPNGFVVTVLQWLDRMIFRRSHWTRSGGAAAPDESVATGPERLGQV